MSSARYKNITAMIPAKLGSRRLPMKNLALLNGKPLIYYAIEAAKRSHAFGRIIINAEDSEFSGIAGRYGVDFYKRPDTLVRPDAKTDEVVYDFLRYNPCDIVAWVSPIAPLQTGVEVRSIVDHFLKERLDSLMTVRNEQVHCVHKDRPINFIAGGIFAQTQDLLPVQSFVYSVMMWRSDVFIRTFERKGYALLCGKLGYFAVAKPSAIIVKKEEDLMLAECMMRALSRKGGYRTRYDRIVNGIKR